jgi:hypothetical protein
VAPDDALTFRITDGHLFAERIEAAVEARVGER